MCTHPLNSLRNFFLDISVGSTVSHHYKSKLFPFSKIHVWNCRRPYRSTSRETQGSYQIEDEASTSDKTVFMPNSRSVKQLGYAGAKNTQNTQIPDSHGVALQYLLRECESSNSYHRYDRDPGKSTFNWLSKVIN